jgi:hypothetical protein
VHALARSNGNRVTNQKTRKHNDRRENATASVPRRSTAWASQVRYVGGECSLEYDLGNSHKF